MLKKNETRLTREEAVKKMGKYALLTALGTLVILEPLKAQSASPPDPGGNPLA